MQRPWGSRSLSHQLLCNSILLCSSIRRIQSGFPQTCIQRSSAHNPLPLRWPKLTLTLRRAILSHFTLSSFKSPQLRMGASFLRELPPMGLCKMCVCVCVCVCMYACVCIHAQLCPTLCDLHGLWPARLLCLWNFPGKNSGVVCHFLLQGNFPTQG